MSLRWIPNAISLVRIALVAPIVALLLEHQYEIALLLFIFAGGSDGVDGFLAKHFAWQTRLGGLLDPIADKTLVSATFVTLALVGLVPVGVVAIVVARDVVIVGGALAWQFFIAPVEGLPSVVSKLNTACQLSFVVFVLSAAAYGWPPAGFVTVLGAACVFTAIVSGMNYVVRWSVMAWEFRHSPGGCDATK
jgi:cardiolipin synthase